MKHRLNERARAHVGNLVIIEVIDIDPYAPNKNKVRSQKKNDIIWEFFPTWGGGLPKSQNFCKFTKYFFVCQIHSEVLKHVLQMGG